MKRLLIILLALMMLLSFASCGKAGYFEKSIEDPTLLRVGITDPIASLGADYTNQSEEMIIRHMTARLVSTGEDGIPVGELAESWVITTSSDAAKRPIYTFTLRDNLAWSNGESITAEDFVNAWTKIISGEVESPYKYLFYTIKGVADYTDSSSKIGLEAKDEKTLVVTLEGKDATFIETVASTPFSLFPGENGECAGMYSLFENNDNKVVLDKNEKYWGSENIQTKRLEFTTGTENEIRDLVEKNLIDATTVYIPECAGYPSTPKMEKGFIFNQGKLDHDFCKAVALGLIGQLEEGFAALQELTTMPNSVSIVVPEGIDYDWADATSFLTEWGINPIITEVAADQYQNIIANKDFDLIYFGFSKDTSSDMLWLSCFESDRESNMGDYSNEEYDNLLAEIRKETQDMERLEKVATATVKLQEDGAFVPFGNTVPELYYHPTIYGIVANGNANWNLGYTKIENA